MSQAEVLVHATSEWIDLIDAAERQGCCRRTLLKRIRNGMLPVVSKKVIGRNGRRVTKIMMEVADLEAAFFRPDPQIHIDAIEASAPPLTEGQTARIAVALRAGSRRRTEAGRALTQSSGAR